MSLNNNEIENIIGTKSTTGAKFAESLEAHLKDNEVAFKEGHVVKKIKEDSEIKPDKIKNVYIYSPYKL